MVNVLYGEVFRAPSVQFFTFLANLTTLQIIDKLGSWPSESQHQSVSYISGRETR
jgi:hypothetical protein